MYESLHAERVLVKFSDFILPIFSLRRLGALHWLSWAMVATLEPWEPQPHMILLPRSANTTTTPFEMCLYKCFINELRVLGYAWRVGLVWRVGVPVRVVGLWVWPFGGSLAIACNMGCPQPHVSQCGRGTRVGPLVLLSDEMVNELCHKPLQSCLWKDWEWSLGGGFRIQSCCINVKRQLIQWKLFHKLHYSKIK